VPPRPRDDWFVERATAWRTPVRRARQSAFHHKVERAERRRPTPTGIRS
jgi:hypothetical protein